MKIKIYSNIIYGGWSAKQYDSGLGGSEEKLIEFSREMVKRGHEVTVYMNGEWGNFDGVEYKAHGSFEPLERHDVFISFKAKEILTQSINAKKKFHWTTEIEPEWPKYLLNEVDAVICISKYQLSRMPWLGDKGRVMYLWADMPLVVGVHKKENSILYSSSFDRGLEELLKNWAKVKETLEVDKLVITYGWDFMDKMLKFNPRMAAWKESMVKLMEQEGVEMLGRVSNDQMWSEYAKAKYWCLPLNNPDSELFCINAIKAQLCGAQPLVIKAGSLQETVHNFVSWKMMLNGQQTEITKAQIESNVEHAIKFDLKGQIDQWVELIS
jgi:glycosyltransferase involved in cell wall biosynthesis